MIAAGQTEEMFCLRVPFGWVRILAGKKDLIGVEVLSGEFLGPTEQQSEHSLLLNAAWQLSRYFQDASSPFTLPLKQTGTVYQQRVWSAMREIPAGQTVTYAGLAREIGSGPRAIAGACKANRFPILIPCHRVVGARGLGGYCGEIGGPMLEIKRWLLRHEGAEPVGQ